MISRGRKQLEKIKQPAYTERFEKDKKYPLFAISKIKMTEKNEKKMLHKKLNAEISNNCGKNLKKVCQIFFQKLQPENFLKFLYTVSLYTCIPVFLYTVIFCKQSSQIKIANQKLFWILMNFFEKNFDM